MILFYAHSARADVRETVGAISRVFIARSALDVPECVTEKSMDQVLLTFGGKDDLFLRDHYGNRTKDFLLLVFNEVQKRQVSMGVAVAARIQCLKAYESELAKGAGEVNFNKFTNQCRFFFKETGLPEFGATPEEFKERTVREFWHWLRQDLALSIADASDSKPFYINTSFFDPLTLPQHPWEPLSRAELAEIQGEMSTWHTEIPQEWIEHKNKIRAHDGGRSWLGAGEGSAEVSFFRDAFRERRFEAYRRYKIAADELIPLMFHSQRELTRQSWLQALTEAHAWQHSLHTHISGLLPKVNPQDSSDAVDPEVLALARNTSVVEAVLRENPKYCGIGHMVANHIEKSWLRRPFVAASIGLASMLIPIGRLGAIAGASIKTLARLRFAVGATAAVATISQTVPAYWEQYERLMWERRLWYAQMSPNFYPALTSLQKIETINDNQQQIMSTLILMDVFLPFKALKQLSSAEQIFRVEQVARVSQLAHGRRWQRFAQRTEFKSAYTASRGRDLLREAGVSLRNFASGIRLYHFR